MMIVRLAQSTLHGSGELGLPIYRTTEAPRIDGVLKVKIKRVDHTGEVIEDADELDLRTFANIEGDI